MLIDETYFHGDINLTPVTGTSLTDYIDKYEKKFFKAMLGDELAAEFIAGYAEDPRPQIWQDLADAMIADSDLLLSPIANYVYYFWVNKEYSFNSLLGEGIANTENAQRIEPTYKAVNAWNEMVEWNKDLVDFIKDNIEDYANYDDSKSIYLISFKNTFNL
jgi:hypothetical protein